MVEALYTVKDLARMCAPMKDADTIKRTMRQIRHWTNNDILSPLGQKNTGIGVSRVYDGHGARKAAILVELARYGVTVDMLNGFDAWCDRASKKEEWQHALLPEAAAVFVGVRWKPGASSKGVWHLYRDDDFFGLHVGAPDFAGDPGIFSASSFILINITEVFKRVRQ